MNHQIFPPIAPKIDKELVCHGDVRIDPYYWLNDREDQKVIDYLTAENNYTSQSLEDVKVLQDQLFSEMTGRIKQTDESVPYRVRGFWYYYRYETGKEYPIHCRKADISDAMEEILLDVNKLVEGQAYCHVEGLEVSPDNRFLAFGQDFVSRRLFTIRIIDLKTGFFLEEQIPGASEEVAWANDNKTIFYTLKNQETLREERVMKHVIGTEISQDTEVFFESDEAFTTSVFKSKSQQFIFIASTSTVSDEYWCLDAYHPEKSWSLIQKRERGLEYSVDHFRDRFYIRTNWEAQNFRMMETSLDLTSKENWKEVFPYQKEVFTEGFEIFDKFLVVAERINASCNLNVIRWDDKTFYTIPFQEEVYEAGIDFNPEFNSDVLRFNYSSLTTPNSIYDFNLITRELTLLKRQEVVGDFNPENYVSKRLFAEASDGTKIPISLVHHKKVKPEAQNPLLLYGYGSYGISMDPYFSSVRLSLLDRGFIFAIAHIRGGQENGRPWYEDGKLLKKKNTFTDFIACADYLVEKRMTGEDKLFAMGGSAGGLLIGVVMNLRPDLFKGMIAAVPFVDVITTMLDDSIPLTTGEYDEWGNPNIREFYDYMKSYSPYDNVCAKEYPNVLVTTGLHDSQVQYFEPAKWVAKLRDQKTDHNLLLLHTNMDAGHGGASGRFERYRETALEYAFLLKLTGIFS